MTATANGHQAYLKNDRQRRDALLSGVAEAARRLLAIADFDAAVNGALEAIGTASGIDRIFVYQHHVDVQTQREFADCPHEWTVPGIVRSCDLPGQFPMFYDEIAGYTDWLAELKAGRAVQKLAKEMSDVGQEKQIQEQALSVLTVPIFLGGSYWGNFGFDDCTTERVWSEAEIAVLETAAASFAGALQRRRDVAELERRDTLLNSVNAAAQCLVATDDLERAIPEALRILGEGTRQDRVYVFENVFPKGPDEVFWEVSYEWVKKGVPTSAEVTASEWPIAMASFPPDIVTPLWDGQTVRCLTSELDGEAKAVNQDGQTLSLIAVPVSVSGQWWGVLGFDDCTTERVWSDAEIAVLETAAACIGSAIERDRTRQEREAAARARAAELEAHNRILERRDLILHATATASNVLLNGEDFDASVSEALEILGESLGFDRIAVGQQFDDPTGETSGFVRFLYEWDGHGISAQLQDFEDMTDFHWDEVGLRSWYEANLRGEAFSQLLEDLPEPFRTLQQSVDVKATHNIPIFVEGQFWGVFGIDHCRERRLLTAVELVALKTAANCVGGAIARDRSRKAREATARARAEELEAHNQALAERDRILEATAAAANVMLTEENFDSAVNDALQIIGAGLKVDRVLLGQHFDALPEQEFGFFQFVYEWAASNTSLQSEHPELSKISDEGIEDIVENLRAGEIFGGIVDELPEPFRSGQLELGVQSTYSIPVLVEGQFWGVLGLDDCHRQTRRSEAELEALRTLANCIGSAIERENSRRVREAVERERATEQEAHNQALAERDRILETATAASNVMLTEEDFHSAVNSALQIIGDGLGVDRVGLMKHFDPTPQAPGYHLQMFEWAAAGISRQIEHPELVRVSDRGIEFVAEQLARGEIFGGVVAELPEPFRSGQQELGVQSTYAVPIVVKGRFWGILAFDDCYHQTRRSEAELEALRTLANCIGSAIEREQLRQAELQAQAAREAAERNVLRERERAARERAAQLQSSNEILSLRDRWLGATAAAAEQLLSGDDFKSVIDDALRTLGEGVGVDRAVVAQLIEDPTGQTLGVGRIQYEWDSPFASSVMATGNVDIPNAGLEECLPQLLAGEWIGGIVDDFNEPFKSEQIALGVQSTYIVPILLGKKVWGAVSVDHCREKRRLSETEIAVFQTAASCIGSAMQRDQIRQAREAAERTALIERERAARAAELEAANAVLTTRDRWLETAATAANQLLCGDDVAASVNVALATIGENLDCERITVMEYIRDPDAPPDNLGLMRLLYEWDAEGIAAQMDAPELSEIPADGIEDWFRQLLRGQCVGGVVAELDEPFRSGQQKLGVQSTYGVPVFVEGTLWGVVAMDHCQEARRLSAAELAVFRTAATCVGSSIYQERVRQDRAALERARLLSSVAEAANLLLRSADYTAVLPEVTRLLGEAVGSDRCSVTQDVIHPDSGHLAVKLLHEWCAAGRESTATCVPEFLDEGQHLRLDGSFLEFHQSLLRGEVVNFLVADLSAPEREFMEAQGNTSMLIVPIMVQGQCWGEMGFDNCGEPRLYDEAEISILRVAAESIAAAIARQAQEESTRESEERYRNLIELSTEGIYRLELDEPIPRNLPVREQVDLFYKRCYGAEANDAFAAMYGYQTAQEMIGWRLTDIHVEASQQNIEFLSEWLASPDCRISNSESEEQDISGNVHYFLNNVIGIVEGDRLVRVWGTQTDVTELKQIQQAREAAEKAVLAEREKAAQERVVELAKTNEAIGQTLSALTETPELDEFLGQILTRISESIEACKAHLFLYDEETDTLHQHLAIQNGKAYQGAAPGDPEMFRHPIPTDLSTAWERIVNSPKPFTLDERNPEAVESYWPESISWHEAEGHLSSTCACMKVGHQPIGFIGFAFRHIAVLSDEQLEFIQALTNQATLSVHLTRLADEAKQAAILQEQEKAAQERAVQLTRSNQALKRSIDSLAQQPELQAFLQRVVNEAVAQTGAANGHLFLYDSSAKAYSLHVATENEGDWRSVRDMKLWQQPIPLDEAPAFGEMMLGKKPFYVQDLQTNLKPGPHIWQPSIDWHLQRGHKSFICAPLVMGDRVLGFMGLPFVDECLVTQDDIELAQALTNQATLAVQLTRLAEEAKQAAVLQEQEKAAQERAAELAKTNEAIAQTLEALTTTPELNEFLGQILTQIIEQIGADDTHLFLYDAETHTLRSQLAVQNSTVHLGTAPGDPDIFYTDIPADITAAWQILVNAPKPVTLDDNNPEAAEFYWPKTLEWHASRGHQSGTCACMKIGEHPIGFIGFAFCDRTVLTNEQLEFIQALTNQATLAIHLTRLAEQARTNALNNERTRLAREIHDTLAQAFTGVSLQLEAVRGITTAKNGSFPSMQDFTEAQACIRRARDLARAGLSEARRSVRALRSEALETDTLPDALRKALAQTQRDTNLETHFYLEGDPAPLPDDLELNLLRISQEAITNTLRHAQAAQLDLTLSFRGDRIQLRIADDGNGFNPAQLATKSGFGLLGIRERTTRFYGSFDLISTPGIGTTIEVSIPLNDT